ncbi:MAG TPA: chemotaxis protein CheD [Sphingomonas sp.]|jgi:chemotaxis protein CheD|uniref:chemotaxis protein CheD n=1 Tax=Sphingomonas sp. TaxID=28214 RepID=UPI002EDAE3D6
MSFLPPPRPARPAPPPIPAPVLRQDGFRHVNVPQGEYQVSLDPTTMLTTILGSCVAACLYDPVAKVGGMNHFLLAHPHGNQILDPVTQQRYGVHAMELLINAMLRHGAQRPRLRAHLYGGGNLHSGMQAIGTANGDFARAFLADEGIPLLAQDLGGKFARRVEFQPALGRARSKIVADTPVDRVAAPPPRRVPAPIDDGDVDLF